MTELRSSLVAPPGERGLRPTLDELCQNTRLLIKFRWAAGFSILFCTGFAEIVLSVKLDVVPLVGTGLFVLFYNSLLFFTCRDANETLERVQRVAWGQIVLDWVAMTVLVHLTGGITSPALIFFVIHAALSGTVLLTWQTRSLSFLAIAIVGALALLERSDWLPYIEIDEFDMGSQLYRNGTYITAVMFFFGTTIVTLSELVSRRTQRMRQREQHIRQLYDARSTFVRVATHELRAPLAASLSLMLTLEQGYMGEITEQQGAILARVTQRLRELSTLVDDLLTLAASQEASASHTPLAPESVRAALLKMVERERAGADIKGITVHCDLDDREGIVLAGDVGLQIIFGNLLNNAVKYTPEAGQVTVNYSISAGYTEVKISDTGIGIPADDIPNIFQEFFRAKNAKQARINGTGIGLSAVNALVERYRGTIALHSDEGQGTTFTVRLPLAARHVLHDSHQAH
ncbi:MAG: HAMP domain-containing histidine kinase [Chloroflexi bacterium]|nr:HAMP domain-containing histidine kinase [Chloroflexota bacterium]